MGMDAIGKYFHFVDNSTNNRGMGDYWNNKVCYNATTGKLAGKCNTTYTSNYTVTQIRKSIKLSPPQQ